MATAGPAIVALALIVAWSGIYHSEKFDTSERGGMKCFTKRAMAAPRRGAFGHIEAYELVEKGSELQLLLALAEDTKWDSLEG